jgi:TetR/AcrR family transcriptional repressor of nem operon
MPAEKASRDQILNKAFVLFRTRGYQATSMTDVAEACGIQKGSLYYQFESKDDLLRCVLRRVNGFAEEKIFALAKGDAPAAERLEHMCRRIARDYARGEGGCIVGNLALETTGTTDAFVTEFAAFFDMLIGAFRTVLVDLYPTAEAKELAERCAQELEGAFMLDRVFPRRGYAGKTLRRIVALADKEYAG